MDSGERVSLQSEVAAALHGERVDRVVSMLTGLSRKASAVLVEDGRITVDGVVVSGRSQRVQGGQRLGIDWVAPPIEETSLAPAPDMPIEVIYDDDTVIVVNKAPGVVVHPGNGVPDTTLVQGLLARYPELAEVGEAHRPGIVHRLDRGTSGLLVVARTEQAYHHLVAQLAARTVHRRYLALVIGRPGATSGLIDAPIGRSRHDPTRRAVVADGREARTHYHVVESFEEPQPLALLSCDLETGRTHQIRVHLLAIGLPVVADPIYGGSRQRMGLQRPFLHATQLAFIHPVSGEEQSFDVPLAQDLAAVMVQLRAPRGQVLAPDA